MKHPDHQSNLDNLPLSAREFIKLVIRKMRYRKKVRLEVQAELAAHFEDELKDCQNEQQRQDKARQLIEQFGDAKLLGILLRRAKKRCRPLWQKAAVRTFQVLGVFVLYLLVCLAPLVTGRPTISTDYVEWLNELVRAGRNEKLNAWPYYDKAADLYVKPPKSLSQILYKWPDDFNDAQLAELSAWLAENAETVKVLREAVERPYYWFDYSTKEQEPTTKKSQPPRIGATHRIVTPAQMPVEGLMSSLLESLAKYRRLARMMQAYISFEAYSGNVSQALDDCVVLLKMARRMQAKGLLIEQLVGTAIEGLSHGVLLDVLAKVDVPAELLAEMQKNLEQELPKPQTVINFEAEKVFLYDWVQRTFTDDGHGGGRALLRALPLVVHDWKDALWKFATFGLPERAEVVQQIDSFFDQGQVFFEKTPKQLRHTDISEDSWADSPVCSRALATQVPAHVRVAQQAWRLKTHRLGVLTTLALLRFQKETGGYPGNLDELASKGYLGEVPVDPYSGKPLIYRKTDDGFILYSVGPNFTDDDGQTVRTKSGRIKMWDEEGDFILWPVTE